MGSDPLYVVISIGRRADASLKDTAANIQTSSEYVVNLVTEELLAAMNVSAAEFPPEESELSAVDLHAAQSVRVKAPRLAEVQASLECRLFQSLPLVANTLYIGEVVMFHVADRLLGSRMHIDDFGPIGRLGSPSIYCRTTDRLEVPRIDYAQWKRT